MVTDTELVEQALKELAGRLPHYRQYWRYYIGDQPLRLAHLKLDTAFAELFAGFCDNQCRPVVDSLVDRLSIDDYIVDDHLRGVCPILCVNGGGGHWFRDAS